MSDKKFFVGTKTVKCAVPIISGPRRIVYGTADGVYLSDLGAGDRTPLKALELSHVSQVDILEECETLIVLSEQQVITFPLDALDTKNPKKGLKLAKKISSKVSFFKVGVCLGKTLVCVVKASTLSSVIKTFELRISGGEGTLKFLKEFYVPCQLDVVHFLKTKLCVGSSNGFDVVDLETLDSQLLLDPSDKSLDFAKKDMKPMEIYRIDGHFLLCFEAFSFYVNPHGMQSRKGFLISWEGSPKGFAFRYPYILAFKPNSVEIRHCETGLVSQVIDGSNIRLLFAFSPANRGVDGLDEILMVSDDRVMSLQMSKDHTSPDSPCVTCTEIA